MSSLDGGTFVKITKHFFASHFPSHFFSHFPALPMSITEYAYFMGGNKPVLSCGSHEKVFLEYIHGRFVVFYAFEKARRDHILP